MGPRAVPRRQHRLLVQAIERWRQDGVISAEVATSLRGSITAARFDWKRVAAYSFIVAIACLVIAVSAAIADQFLMALLARLFSVSAIGKSLAFAVAAALVFVWALMRRGRAPERIYSNEARFFVGVLSLATSVLFFGQAIDRGTGDSSVLFLLATVLYALLGWRFPPSRSGPSASSRSAAGWGRRRATSPAGAPITSA